LSETVGPSGHRIGTDILSTTDRFADGSLYLFDTSGRASAKSQLLEDIPRLISEAGYVTGVGDFYESIYNVTPTHSDDVHTAIVENPDIEVITPAGGERRKASTIDPGYTQT
jgi:hypothetical protein